jgi:hypothetical protein
MKKLLFILFSILCFIGYSQEYIPINTGYGFEGTTTTQLNALTKKAEGDFFYDTVINSHVYWDGSTFKLFSTKNYIDVLSPRTPFDFAFGTWDELAALTFDNNTVLIPTNDNGDFVTTDGFVDGLSLGIVGSDLTLTATRNGLSNLVSNTITLPNNSITLDLIPTDASTNGVESNGIFDEFQNKADLSDSNTYTGINTYTSSTRFRGSTYVEDENSLNDSFLAFKNLNNPAFTGRVGFNGSTSLELSNINSGETLLLKSTGELNYTGLSGTGTQMVVANALGDISRQDIPSTGVSQTIGPWTPVLEAGADTPYTYTAQGYYIKTGDMVLLWAYLTNINGTAASGNLEITGLPFSANVASFSSEQQMFPYFITGTSSAAITNPIGEVSSTTLRLRNQDGVTNSGNAGVDFAGSGTIIINMVYIAQ